MSLSPHDKRPIKPVIDAIWGVRDAQAAMEAARRSLNEAWADLAKATGYPVGEDAERGYAMERAMSLVAEHALAERGRSS